MVRSLSPADVTRLMADPSPEARAATAANAARTLDESDLTATERAELEELLRILARDAQVPCRRMRFDASRWALSADAAMLALT